MEILLSCTALFLLSVGAGKLLSFAIANQSVQKVKERNQNNENKQSVFLKKYKEVDTDRWRTTNMLMGVALAIGFLLVSAETFTKKKEINADYIKITDDFGELIDWIDDEEDFVAVPPPPVAVPPPPPPTSMPDIIEVDEVIDEPQVIQTPEVVDLPPIPVIPSPPALPININPPVVAPPGLPASTVDNVPPNDVILDFVSVMPEFEGGLDELRIQVQRSYDIPRKFVTSGAKGGTIVTRFVVNEDGSMGRVEIVKGMDGCEICDEEAIKAIRNVKGSFTPGKQAGKPVKVWFTMPIVIRIK